jgi:hypothetical protein
MIESATMNVDVFITRFLTFQCQTGSPVAI